MKSFQSIEQVVAGLDPERSNQAREKFYPDWWMFANQQDPDDLTTAPHYTVVPKTEEELILAYRVKPLGVVADIRPVEETK